MLRAICKLARGSSRCISFNRTSLPPSINGRLPLFISKDLTPRSHFAQSSKRKKNKDGDKDKDADEDEDDKKKETLPEHIKWLDSDLVCSFEHFNFEPFTSVCEAALKQFKEELGKMTIVQAAPTLLDGIKIDVKELGVEPAANEEEGEGAGSGSTTLDLLDVAQIIVKNPQQLLVRVFEDEVQSPLMKVFQARFRTQNWTIETDGKNGILISIPKGSPDHCIKLFKDCKLKSESVKSKIKQAREKGKKEWLRIRADFSKDDQFKIEAEFQKIERAYDHTLTALLTQKKNSLGLAKVKI